MESRLSIPSLDIPKHWYSLEFPATYRVNKTPTMLTFKKL
jgi:hypothetical protein